MLQTLPGKRKRNSLVLFWVFFLIIALFPVAGWAQTQQPGPFSGQVNKTHVVVYPDAEQHADAILGRVLSANNLPPNLVSGVQVIQSSDLNAATDGKKIVFSSGLWNLLNTDDQRAFVISHELSHVILNHVPKTQVRRVSLLLLDQLLARRLVVADNPMRSQLLQLATNEGLSLVDYRFSRQAEYQADDRGLQLMSNAGYRPQAAIEVFNLFEKNSPDTTPEFLRDHPLNKSRIQALIKKYPNPPRQVSYRRY